DASEHHTGPSIDEVRGIGTRGPNVWALDGAGYQRTGPMEAPTGGQYFFNLKCVDGHVKTSTGWAIDAKGRAQARKSTKGTSYACSASGRVGRRSATAEEERWNGGCTCPRDIPIWRRPRVARE